jgi:hypothetical protein
MASNAMGRQVKSIETIISQLVSDNELNNEFIFTQLVGFWEENFPDTLAKNVKLTKYENKLLYMQTDFPSWHKEIILRSSDLIRQFNKHFGTTIVTKIYI